MNDKELGAENGLTKDTMMGRWNSDVRKRDTSYDHRGKSAAVREIILDDKQYAANSLTIPVMATMIRYIKEAAAQKRMVVITNSGSAFCGGLDRFALLRNMARMGSCGLLLDCLIDLYKAIVSHPLTVSWINGKAAGGGVGLAFSCRRVFAHNQITFEIPGGGYRELAAVLIPIIKRRRPRQPFPIERLVGHRPFRTAEAVEWNLVDHVFRDGADMSKIIPTRISPWPPVRWAKRGFTKKTLDELRSACRRAKTPDVTRAIASGLVYSTVRSIEKRLQNKR